ncbi:uncharacterized protein LOC125178484 [Hyalella azteca]|uniref:Uncharacterized protein LOC125178484 n=1 Tax=Hyalella azteca TaxID=294128 RepID=A0A979FMH1_HYAAZ|nr:uncharacterized protein LOC125178484 [Hyalella azteca]
MALADDIVSISSKSVREQNCYRCLVIHQKHENVLQYKESECGWSNKLDHVCNLLTGDSKLNSMFRLDAVPVPCPFPHSYTFEYNNGGGLCTNPPSTVHSCTESWRLLFQYQACPDVRGSESMVEELTCLGVWKEGSNHYLVGISDHRRVNSDADKYRCYAYAGSGNGFKMAKSGDASCHGLFSLTGGASTLRLNKVETRGSRCHFPLRHSEWHSLDGKGRLHVTRHNTTLRYSTHGESGPITYTCFHTIKSLPETSSYHRHGDSSYYRTASRSSSSQQDEFEVSAASVSSSKHMEEKLGYFVTRVFHGCTSGFKCIKLVERDHQVLEILMGKVASVAEEACSHHFFDASSTNYSTFISSNAESRSCPSMGRYEVVADMGTARAAASSSHAASPASASAPQASTGGGSGTALSAPSRDGCEAPYTALTVGCSASDTLEMHTSCSNAVYSCHGWWQEPGGRQFLVVTPTSRASTGARRLCLVLESHGPEDAAGGAMTIASSTGYCSRYWNMRDARCKRGLWSTALQSAAAGRQTSSNSGRADAVQHPDLDASDYSVLPQ